MVALPSGPVSKPQCCGQGSAQRRSPVAHPTRGLRGVEDGSAREAYVLPPNFDVLVYMGSGGRMKINIEGIVQDRNFDLDGKNLGHSPHPPRMMYGQYPTIAARPHSIMLAFTTTTMGHGNPIESDLVEANERHTVPKGTLWWWMRSMKYPR
jgi:hypothetical protein